PRRRPMHVLDKPRALFAMIALLLVLGLVAACGGDGGGDDESATSDDAAEEAATTDETAGGEEVTEAVSAEQAAEEEYGDKPGTEATYAEIDANSDCADLKTKADTWYANAGKKPEGHARREALVAYA